MRLPVQRDSVATLLESIGQDNKKSKCNSNQIVPRGRGKNSVPSEVELKIFSPVFIFMIVLGAYSLRHGSAYCKAVQSLLKNTRLQSAKTSLRTLSSPAVISKYKAPQCKVLGLEIPFRMSGCDLPITHISFESRVDFRA